MHRTAGPQLTGQGERPCILAQLYGHNVTHLGGVHKGWLGTVTQNQCPAPCLLHDQIVEVSGGVCVCVCVCVCTRGKGCLGRRGV